MSGRQGQHSCHAFGEAGFAGGFPLHDPDGDGPGSGGPAFFVGATAAGWGAPTRRLRGGHRRGAVTDRDLALGGLGGIGRRRRVLLNP